jgi:hypothetical protein
MQTYVASGQCATRGPKWSECVFRRGYGWKGINLHSMQVRMPVIVHRNDLSSMRAASSSAPSYMREGLSGWYVTIDPPVCKQELTLGEASQLDASRVYMLWVMG